MLDNARAKATSLLRYLIARTRSKGRNRPPPCSRARAVGVGGGHLPACLSRFPPHTVTLFPSRPPSHSSVEHVRCNRFFQISELTKTSSSGLNNEKMLREATRIILRFARLRATVNRRGSSRNLLGANR